MNQTTGSFTAKINNPQVSPAEHSFQGDADRMMLYFLDNELRISATQKIGPGINDVLGFDFVVPNIAADGVERTYSLGNQARGTYWAHENLGVAPYSAITGSLRLSLDSRERLVGTFSFSAVLGSKRVEITQGVIALIGLSSQVRVPQVTGTGFMRGSVPGGPMPAPEFDTKDVSIRTVAGTFTYWEVVGRQYEDLPRVQNLVLIVVREGTTDKVFDLATSTEVSVSFGRIDSFGFAHAINGRLEFTALPETGRAVGSLDCQVQRNQETPFALKMTFDITDSV